LNSAGVAGNLGAFNVAGVNRALFEADDHAAADNGFLPARFHVAEYDRTLWTEFDGSPVRDIIHELYAGDVAFDVLNDGDRSLGGSRRRDPGNPGERNCYRPKASHDGTLSWKHPTIYAKLLDQATLVHQSAGPVTLRSGWFCLAAAISLGYRRRHIRIGHAARVMVRRGQSGTGKL
jgi:hypothetical protein